MYIAEIATLDIFTIENKSVQSGIFGISLEGRENEVFWRILPAALSEEQRTLIVACSWYNITVTKMYH
jgi:hypothetical protein